MTKLYLHIKTFFNNYLAFFLQHIIQLSLEMKMIKTPQKTCRLIIVTGILFFASGCSQLLDFTKKTTGPTSCADFVIERAFNLHEEAKTGLALFFEERSDNQLYQAFYAASDSVSESRKVKKCWDRRLSHFYAMQNLQEMNSSLARVIRRNLPDDDRGEMIAIYHNQYEWVMPNSR